MTNPELLEKYFSVFIEKLDRDNAEKLKEAFRRVPDTYYTYPAASGNHHNALQGCVHGLLYHVYEGSIALSQFIRSHPDLMSRIKANENYTGVSPESDLVVAYLMHDICKYNENPTGTNHRHDEAAYEFAKSLNFNEFVCNVIRFTHGQWSTAIVEKLADFRGTWYEQAVWLSHHADMAASSMTDMRFIERLEKFDKTIFTENRKRMKNNDGTINREWWRPQAVVENMRLPDDSPAEW